MFVKALMVLASSSTFHLTGFTQNASCLVLGERTAKVMSSDGEKSPVFVARNCESLKLIDGKAQASWVARDGRPRVVPITPEGLGLLPTSGVEGRSVNTVWSELSSKRARQQPAFMRSLGEVRTPTIYIPVSGLLMAQESDDKTTLRIFKRLESDNELLQSTEIPKGGAIRLQRRDFSPDQVYLVQTQKGEVIENREWKTLSAGNISDIDAKLMDIEKVVDVPDQRLMLQAMLFEQLKLQLNKDLLIKQLQTSITVFEPVVQ